MKRNSLFLLLVTLLLTFLLSSTVLAQTQPGDPDNDGVFGTKDRCPNDPGPASNNGCPLPKPNEQPQPTAEQPTHPPGDSDGDGTLDEKDKCPLDGGPDWNNGCPTTQTAPQVVLPTMPTSGECVVATQGQDRVNVRELPSTTAAIIAVLNPSDLYPAFATFTHDGEVWYLVSLGWVSSSVIRTGGSCNKLPGFDFGDVETKLTKGPGEALILNFIPVPGGKPFINLHPFGDVSLNFTKTADDDPDTGFSFLLTPFPGSPGGQPENPQRESPSNVFDDGFLLSHMGDGSVFILMPPTIQSGENPLNGILIGLNQPDIDPNGILIGLNQPDVDPEKILIGLNQPGSLNGILIGLLLPAVQKIKSNDGSQGILIGLLLPAVQKVREAANSPGFGFGGDGGSSPGDAVSVQKIRGMGIDFFAPGADAPTMNFFTDGWHVEAKGLLVPAV